MPTRKRKGNWSQKQLEAAAARKDREQQRRNFFAHALEARLTQLGMTQSELAREVNRILPPGVRISRSSISKYVHAKIPTSKPNPVRLAAIAKVLGVDQSQLVPSGRAADKFIPVDFSATTDGRALLRINRTFSMKAALAILRIVQEEDAKGGA
jgi:transcriptional regulator with XRE-family HTH domain